VIPKGESPRGETNMSTAAMVIRIPFKHESLERPHPYQLPRQTPRIPCWQLRDCSQCSELELVLYGKYDPVIREDRRREPGSLVWKWRHGQRQTKKNVCSRSAALPVIPSRGDRDIEHPQQGPRRRKTCCLLHEPVCESGYKSRATLLDCRSLCESPLRYPFSGAWDSPSLAGRLAKHCDYAH
jgi:hypothetical protein